jgi:uncharacterized membrane protein
MQAIDTKFEGIYNVSTMEIVSILHKIGTFVGLICALLSAFIMVGMKTDQQRRGRGRIARRIAPVTWSAFILLIVSGVILAVNHPTGNVIMLRIKHLLVAILLMDALFIHFRYFPRYFKQVGTAEFNKTYAVMRRIGTLSVTCWIIILVLSILSTRFQ